MSSIRTEDDVNNIHGNVDENDEDNTALFVWVCVRDAFLELIKPS